MPSLEAKSAEEMYSEKSGGVDSFIFLSFSFFSKFLWSLYVPILSSYSLKLLLFVVAPIDVFVAADGDAGCG